MYTTKNKKPFVTVLIPVFNGAQFLEETVQSVLKSTYPNFEIILVNDGSTDESAQKCKALAKRYPHVFAYHFRKNGGLARSLNVGLAKASGEYIARINQDDLMEPDRLEQQVAFLTNHSDHVAVGGYVQLFTDSESAYDLISFPITDDEIRNAWLCLSPFADPAVMYRRESALFVGGYNQAFWPADDVHMWYRLGSIGKLANLPTILTRVRWYEGAGSIRYHKEQMRKTWKVHMWARERISQPTVGVWAFWLCELIAGWMLPATANWYVYRAIRKLMAFGNRGREMAKAWLYLGAPQGQ